MCSRTGVVVILTVLGSLKKGDGEIWPKEARIDVRDRMRSNLTGRRVTSPSRPSRPNDQERDESLALASASKVLVTGAITGNTRLRVQNHRDRTLGRT